MDPAIVQQWRGTQVILTDGQLNHRATAIQTVCDLESHLSELLSAVFISRNPNVSHELATKELYADERVLSSLRKMADVAFFLGVIDQEQRFDLKALATLRDRYAHHRHAKQLYDEPDYYALITKTNLYKNNKLLLDGLNEQAVLMCIKTQLMFDLAERLKTVETNSAQASSGEKDA
jgi:DNA-binding MltR family transcriptional regulator